MTRVLRNRPQSFHGFIQRALLLFLMSFNAKSLRNLRRNSSEKKLKTTKNSSLMQSRAFNEIWPNLENLSKKLLRFETIKRTEWQDGISDVFHLSGGSRNMDFKSELELFNHVENFTGKYVEHLMKELLESGDENLFELYSKNWKSFKEGANYVNILFESFNRTSKDYTPKKLLSVLELFYQVWCQKILLILQPDLVRLSRKAIERDRQGFEGSINQISNVVDSFIELSSIKPSEEVLDFYKIAFELPFFEWTEEYYTKIANEFSTTFSCSEYMIKVAYLMEKERERSKKILHSSSQKEVQNICQRVLVEEKLEFIMQNLKTFIETESLRDLSNMYSLIKPSSKIRILIDEFEKYITNKGLESVKKTSGVEPKMIVQTFFDGFLSFHDRYSKIIAERFSSDKDFVAAFDRACVIHVNYKTDKEQCPNASRFLSIYVDRILRKSSKLDPTGDELEQKISQVNTLFKYIEDKDIFQTYFRKTLALRLIHSESSSMDAEASMISKLKSSCGYEFVRKPQQMFNDVNTSKETNQKFVEFCQHVSMSTHKSLYVIVCQSGSWPLNADGGGAKVHLPVEFVPLLENFDLFYKSKFAGRKLIWLHNLSKVDVIVNYLPVQYVITMDFYQACVLFMYNGLQTDWLAFSDIQIQIPIDVEQLNSYLKSFVSCGLLIEETTTMRTFKLNPKFKSSHKKFNIKSPPTKKQVDNEVKQVNNSADMERRHLLECKIVQIMKMRQVLKHMDLITETIKQTSSRFPTSQNLIKQVIEILIEKEYLERSADNRDEYRYKA